MRIKAIETRYKGYTFRSRLEARWAVFFDAMGIDWDYETEGFELSDGTRYLPDFWLPSRGLYVEIKGERPTHDELRKCELLRDGAGRAVWAVHGLPYSNPGHLFAWDTCDSGGGSWDGLASVFDLDDTRAARVVCHSDERASRDRTIWLDCGFQCHAATAFGDFRSASTLHAPVRAAAAARSARFEFGQSGATA